MDFRIVVELESRPLFWLMDWLMVWRRAWIRRRPGSEGPYLKWQLIFSLLIVTN